MADGLLGYWLNAEANDPNLSSGYLAYARWATGVHKAAISNTEEELAWENSELLLVTNDEDIVRAVSALKRQRGKNIVVQGGVRTVQALSRLNGAKGWLKAVLVCGGLIMASGSKGRGHRGRRRQMRAEEVLG